jgi:hypothetical protein
MTTKIVIDLIEEQIDRLWGLQEDRADVWAEAYEELLYLIKEKLSRKRAVSMSKKKATILIDELFYFDGIRWSTDTPIGIVRAIENELRKDT